MIIYITENFRVKWTHAQNGMSQTGTFDHFCSANHLLVALNYVWVFAENQTNGAWAGVS